jgi:template-activating factor I
VAEVDGDDDMPAEAGSFFNFFEIADDPFEVSGIGQSP